MDPIIDQTVERKLTRIYVALAMTREVAQQRSVNNETTNSMLTLINVATQMLEELLDTSTAPIGVHEGPLELEMLM
jgi:hypothetical protein